MNTSEQPRDMQLTFTEECLDETTAGTPVASTNGDGLADSHERDHSVVQKRRDLTVGNVSTLQTGRDFGTHTKNPAQRGVSTGTYIGDYVLT